MTAHTFTIVSAVCAREKESHLQRLNGSNVNVFLSASPPSGILLDPARMG